MSILSMMTCSKYGTKSVANKVKKAVKNVMLKIQLLISQQGIVEDNVMI